MDSFAERFAAVRRTHGPLVWGVDPSGQMLQSWGLGDDPDGLDRFADIVLDVAPGSIGLLKPQSAFFERHGWRGIRTLTWLVEGAREAGILVILDVKRGDVGSTNDAYAESYLGAGAPIESDAITVHPYLGLGAMGAYIERADAAGSCVLVVTRSSNPEGRSIQAAVDETGRSVEQSLIAGIGEINTHLAPGRIGPVGAVVGPTHFDAGLDLASANALYLAPGIGRQGATAADVARTFAACPDRVMPSASRSLLDAGPDPASLRSAIDSLAAEFRETLG